MLMVLWEAGTILHHSALDRALDCNTNTDTTISIPPVACSRVTCSPNTMVAVTTVIAGSAVLSMAALDAPTNGNPAKNVPIAMTVQTIAIIMVSTQP